MNTIYKQHRVIPEGKTLCCLIDSEKNYFISVFSCSTHLKILSPVNLA